MARIGSQIEQTRRVGGEFRVSGRLAYRFLHPFLRTCDGSIVDAIDDEVIGLRVVAAAVPGADGSPQSGMVKVCDAHAGVPGCGWIGPVAAGDFFRGGHLPGGRKLYCGCDVSARPMQYIAEGFEDRWQAYLRMPVSGGDCRKFALRAGQKCPVNPFSERADVLVIARTELVQVPLPGRVLPNHARKAVIAGLTARL